MSVKHITDYCKSVELSKQHTKTLNPSNEAFAVRELKNFKCRKCLYEHLPNKCPAFRKTCALCQKVGHFAKACFNKCQEDPNNVVEQAIHKKTTERNVNGVYQEDEARLPPEIYVDMVKSPWTETLCVENVEVKFKLDTGADCSILPINIFKKVKCNKHLIDCSVTLVTYGNFSMKPIGRINLVCKYKDVVGIINFIVVDADTEALLGLNDCIKFSLIQRIDSFHSFPITKDEVYNKYTHVFEGVGKIPGACSIELDENAKPVIQYQSKVPFSLHEKLKSTLDDLEQKQIIN